MWADLLQPRTGVRPSPGAETSDGWAVPQRFQTLVTSYGSASEDGRTPPDLCDQSLRLHLRPSRTQADLIFQLQWISAASALADSAPVNSRTMRTARSRSLAFEAFTSIIRLPS